MKILWTGFYEGANSDRIQERSYMIIKSGLKIKWVKKFCGV